MRNAYGQIAVVPYAVCARPDVPVATPLDWDELGDAELRADRYHIGNIMRCRDKTGSMERHRPPCGGTECAQECAGCLAV